MEPSARSRSRPRCGSTPDGLDESGRRSADAAAVETATKISRAAGSPVVAAAGPFAFWQEMALVAVAVVERSGAVG
jgi:hypothetical protein